MLVGANSLGVCVPVGRLPPRPSVAAPLSHPGLYVASVVSDGVPESRLEFVGIAFPVILATVRSASVFEISSKDR